MGKNLEKKHFVIIGAVYFLIALGIVIAVSFFQYRAYFRNYNQKLNSICIELEDKYPELSNIEIMEIVDADADTSEEFFSKYGIDMKKQSIILENDRIFNRYLIINILILFVGTGLFVGFVFASYRQREKSIKKVAEYLKKINTGDYSFNMEDSSEGEMSQLESEVYKTTIMLKEAADNSRLDKEKLKDALSDISHQLKTPITSLVINLENLQDNPELELESRNRLIGNAKRDTNRISQMVQQLLTLSKLDANVIEFKKEEVRLKDIVSEAIENISALADLQNIAIEEQGFDDAHAVIVCDSYWEKQAITNILKNCIEHADSCVKIRYANYELYKEIIIENDGEPISEIDRKKIFERFYSGENSTKDSVGIGMSLANAVVKNDGGYIVVEADDMTRFTIRYL